MNSIIQNQYPLFEYYQALRTQMLEILDDTDLAFTLPGNPSLGKLCVEIGEVEQSYIDSFSTFTQDFSYRNREPGMEMSVSRLSAWYRALDAELRARIEALLEKDIAEKLIDRGPDFKVSASTNLEIYKEALLIFYGKSSVYLRALEKSLPEQWQSWIG